MMFFSTACEKALRTGWEKRHKRSGGFDIRHRLSREARQMRVYRHWNPEFNLWPCHWYVRQASVLSHSALHRPALEKQRLDALRGATLSAKLWACVGGTGLSDDASKNRPPLGTETKSSCFGTEKPRNSDRGWSAGIKKMLINKDLYPISDFKVSLQQKTVGLQINLDLAVKLKLKSSTSSAPPSKNDPKPSRWIFKKNGLSWHVLVLLAYQ